MMNNGNHPSKQISTANHQIREAKNLESSENSVADHPVDELMQTKLEENLDANMDLYLN